MFGASALDALSVPQEISDGDLCVTSDSALLDGVKNVATHELKHTALPRDPKVMSLVIKRLTEEP